MSARRWSLKKSVNPSKIPDSCPCLEIGVMNGKKDYTQEEDQRIALKQFHNAVQDILEPYHDDQFLLRWLRARDFDVIKAEKMIRESFKFRKKIGANSILTSTYQLPDVYMKHKISTALGYDKESSVVRFFMAGKLDYKGFVYSLRTMDLMKILIHFLETDSKLVQEKKKKDGKANTKSVFIVDFEDFTLKKFYDKSVINAGIQLIAMYQDNYPETLKAAYLVNVPSYFNWVFNIFKPFLNAVTLSKIRIYKTDEWKDELRNSMDPKLLPTFLGGDKIEHLVDWGGKVESKYYLKQNQQGGEDDPSMKLVTIQQRGMLKVPVEVTAAGSLLKWVFRTKDYNIRYGLYFRKGDTTMEEVLPLETVDCQTIPEENEFLCEKKGTYILYFDNSYSWLTAKQLYYKVEIEKPDVIETNNN